MVIWVVTAALLGGGASSGGAEAAAAPSSGALSGLGVIPPFELAGFFIFFILGYLQLAMLFASAGSLISRTEDLGSVSGPLIIPVIGALFIAIAALGFPDAPWIVGASLVPLIAPFVMFARIAVSNVPVWQVALSLVINVAAVWVISILAGRLYRVGMLLYGRTPKLRQVWATIRG
jgi:ABC-2 type transport system permease protein